MVENKIVLAKEIAMGLNSLRLNSPQDLENLAKLTTTYGLTKVERVSGFYPIEADSNHTPYHGFQFTLKNGQKLRVVSTFSGFIGGYHLEEISD